MSNTVGNSVNTSEAIANKTISEQLLSMEKRVSLYRVTGALRSNRTYKYCDGLPSMEIWAESGQQAQFAYMQKYPQTVAGDLRGVWDVKCTCVLE